VSELATQLGRTDYALIASRGEMAEGPPAILKFAYPQLPLSSELRHNWTMIHAITRQESRFDRTAVSPAGALGLMQLMPATARETAGKVGTAYRVTGLTNDPDYNLLLGSAYFSNLLDAWGGNHVLSVASYNAGAGNVRRWIRENGDPRMPGVDVVEWIESIPIYETRNYVKRVLANAVVYEHLQPQRAEMPSTNTLSAFLGKNRPG
jgi:soluble lytic murein transglycosylase